MRNRLVSVVIPTYNRGNKIAACLDSVCSQTYTNIEIIVIDDCSTDNTKDIVLNYDDSRIRYYCLDKNSGACVARNKGVELAKGDIIAFQDSDDIWHKDKLDKQMIFMVSGNYEFVSCGINRVNGAIKEKIGYKHINEDSKTNWCKLINGNWISTQTIVCYKYCFNKIRFDQNLKRFQDWDFALQAVNYFRIGAMYECLVDVFVQKDSITVNNKAYESMIYILNKHKNDVDFNNRDMVAQYYKSLGDVIRMRYPFKAVKRYYMSLKSKFDCRILIVIVMCLTGIIRIYDRKYGNI